VDGRLTATGLEPAAILRDLLLPLSQEPRGAETSRVAPRSTRLSPNGARGSAVSAKPPGSRERYTCYLPGSTLLPRIATPADPQNVLGKVRPSGEEAEGDVGR
jgi:hypothetical protein